MKTNCDKCGLKLEKPRINIKWAVCRGCQDKSKSERNLKYNKDRKNQPTSTVRKKANKRGPYPRRIK